MKQQHSELNRLFEAQGGLATLAQMMALGMSWPSVQNRRDRGHLVSMAPGVFRAAGAPTNWLTEVAAAALFLGHRAVASKATAARLHGLPSFENDVTVEFSCVRESRGIGGRITVHSARQLDDVDRTTCLLPEWGLTPVPPPLRHLGVLRLIPVTTPCRTIIDLAHRLPVPALSRLVDSSISLRKVTHDQLVERVEWLRDSGVRGVRRMDQVLIDAGVESWLERKFLELLRAAGLPRPRCQVVFKNGSRTMARVDFLFDDTNVVVEVSGRRGHVTDAERQRDARRRNDLQQAGMIVLEFTTSDVVRDPYYVVQTIREALASAHRNS
jgi:hypothetical protein